MYLKGNTGWIHWLLNCGRTQRVNPRAAKRSTAPAADKWSLQHRGFYISRPNPRLSWAGLNILIRPIPYSLIQRCRTHTHTHLLSLCYYQRWHMAGLLWLDCLFTLHLQNPYHTISSAWRRKVGTLRRNRKWYNGIIVTRSMSKLLLLH